MKAVLLGCASAAAIFVGSVSAQTREAPPATPPSSQPTKSTGRQGGEPAPAATAAAAAAGQTDAKGIPLPPLANGDKATEGAPAAVGEVIVTAQRRSQRLQQAPVAVTALSPQALEQTGVRTTQDLMQVVPGLQTATQTAGDNGGSATFFLRGIGQERSGNGSETAVGIYVDDFYYPSLSGTLFKIVDLSQVEVLRGPQGTLFGRNTIGGAIRYTSQQPKLDVFSGIATLTYGSFNREEASGAVNIPVGDIAALRITAGHLQADGYVREQTGGPDAGRTVTDLVRVQARVEPTKDIFIDLSGQISRDKLDGFTYAIPGPITPTPPTPGTTPSLPFVYNTVARLRGLTPYTNALESQCFYCEPGPTSPEFSRTSYRNVLFTIGWDIGHGLSLKSLTGYQEVNNIFSADLDGTIAPLYGDSINPTHTTALSQELQLNGHLLEDRFNFVAGFFYYDEHQKNERTPVPLTVLGGPSFPPLADRTVRSLAGFIDGSFKLTDRLSLLGGFRYSDDDKTITAFAQPSLAVLGFRAASFASETYRAGLTYQFTRDIFGYANVSSGFRAGGFNPYNAAPILSLAAFSPENATSYELGLRTQFFERRLTINPTVFYVDWSDIQIQTVVITDPQSGTGGPVLQNAGDARSYGLELEYVYQATPDLRIFGNLAYLDIRYTRLAPGTGLTLQSDLQRAPPLTFAIGASYTRDFQQFGKATATLNYSYEDDQQSSPKTSLLLPSYALLNGRIDFFPPNSPVTVSVFATNLTGEHYYVGGVDYTNIVGSPHYDVGRPREFGVTLKARF